MPDPRLKTYTPQAIRHLAHAGGDARGAPDRPAARTAGNVPPWAGSHRRGFSRHAVGDLDLGAAPAPVERHALRGPSRRRPGRSSRRRRGGSSPTRSGRAASDEAAYDCALCCWPTTPIAGSTPATGGASCWPTARRALLSAYLGDARRSRRGREFRDPGFLAWALIEYARTVEDRGLLASGRRFVERAFGMKTPPPFASEPRAAGGPVRFLVDDGDARDGDRRRRGEHAVRRRLAARARGGAIVPPSFVPRRFDENTWNACVAWALGRAYVISTDPVFLQAHSEIIDELERRDGDRDGALGRDRVVEEPGDGGDVLLRAGGRFAGDRRRARPARACRRRRCRRRRRRRTEQDPTVTMSDADELREIAARVRTQLEMRGRSGLLGVSRARPSRRGGAAAAARRSAAASPPTPTPTPPNESDRGRTSPARPVGARGPAARPRGDRRLPALPLCAGGRTEHRLRRRQPAGAPRVRGRGAGRRRRSAGRALRRQGGPAADQDDRGDGLRARGRLHLQRHQVPPARQPQPRARRGRGLRAVLEEAARGAAPAHDRRRWASSRRSACCATTRRSRACAATSAPTRASA